MAGFNKYVLGGGMQAGSVPTAQLPGGGFPLRWAVAAGGWSSEEWGSGGQRSVGGAVGGPWGVGQPTKGFQRHRCSWLKLRPR